MKKRQDKAIMRQLYDCWQNEGISQSAFCKQHTINPYVFRYWVQKFRKQQSLSSQASSSKGFSQIGLAGSQATDCQQALATIVFPSGVGLELFTCPEVGFLKELIF